jgi:hypothetical protein
MTALLAILVIAVVVSVVGYPLLWARAAVHTIPLGPITALEDRKLQIYADIRELGFDYRMDKLEKADYEAEVERLKAEAVGVIQQIEEIRSQTPRAPSELEAEIATYREKLDNSGKGDLGTTAKHFCTECGSTIDTDDRFCAACGKEVGSS